ncbi:MAG: KH domain-containing protein [Lachnospiraceae bacterium]|nr:KH domain-containing protein [Lachnospiraceae bacterium]
MKELVIVLAKSLVDNPDQVVVEETETENDITLRLKVADEDMGKVIGKGGRIAKAIRTLVKASAFNNEKKIYVEIGDEKTED